MDAFEAVNLSLHLRIALLAALGGIQQLLDLQITLSDQAHDLVEQDVRINGLVAVEEFTKLAAGKHRLTVICATSSGSPYRRSGTRRLA